jgi:hypothetical protein
MGQAHPAVAARQVAAMALLHPGQVLAQRGLGGPGQQRPAVLAALALAHHQQVLREVHVAHAQAQTLVQAQAGPVEQRGRQAARSVQVLEHGAHLVAREHHRQAPRGARPHHLVQALELAAQQHAVEEEQRAQRLVLRRGAHVPGLRQVREERHHLGCAHLVGMALAVEQDEAARPGHVRVLGADAVVARAQGEPELVEQLGLPRGLGRRHDGAAPGTGVTPT